MSERWDVEEHVVELDGTVTRRTASFDPARPDDGVTLTWDVIERVRVGFRNDLAEREERP